MIKDKVLCSKCGNAIHFGDLPNEWIKITLENHNNKPAKLNYYKKYFTDYEQAYNFAYNKSFYYDVCINGVNVNKIF